MWIDRPPSMLTPHIPTFYVPSHWYPEYLHGLLLMALGSIFGGIHCAGWNFSFPTYAEQKLWRVASSGYHHNPDCCTHLHFYHAPHHPCQCWCSSPICVNFLHLHACMCLPGLDSLDSLWHSWGTCLPVHTLPLTGPGFILTFDDHSMLPPAQELASHSLFLVYLSLLHHWAVLIPSCPPSWVMLYISSLCLPDYIPITMDLHMQI